MMQVKAKTFLSKLRFIYEHPVPKVIRENETGVLLRFWDNFEVGWQTPRPQIISGVIHQDVGIQESHPGLDLFISR